MVVTDSDFILTERTCAIARTADVSIKTLVAADFKREYKNIKLLRDDSAAPFCITNTGKKLVFLVTTATDRQHVNPESLAGTNSTQGFPD